MHAATKGPLAGSSARAGSNRRRTAWATIWAHLSLAGAVAFLVFVSALAMVGFAVAATIEAVWRGVSRTGRRSSTAAAAPQPSEEAAPTARPLAWRFASTTGERRSARSASARRRPWPARGMN
ncbi:MAG: DUF3693 domain-containing protein [Planctomycetota bacterium]|jgi:hypothetical protein